MAGPRASGVESDRLLTENPMRSAAGREFVCLACLAVVLRAQPGPNVAAAAAGSVALRAQDTRRSAVDAALRVAGQYLLQYEQDVSGIVAEEVYVQRVPREGTARRLRSDTLVILDQTAGWVSFRDIFEVDGKAVRDRDERLAKLFMQPNRDAFAQARRIVEEGSRFNLNPTGGGISRTINQPYMALKFLRTANQPRSEFAIDPSRLPERASEVLLTFVEKAKPRLIRSPDNAAARGSFWIDSATGRVSRSELSIQTGVSRITIRVAYSEQPSLKVWLPITMDESYATYPTGIEGHATYSNFRQFKVETDTIVK
jgi:hypothetical protein